MSKGEEVLNIVSKGVEWVSQFFSGPSKKEMNLRISDLENQLSTIAEQNRIMVDNYDDIISAIMQQLGNHYELNIDSIIYISGNTAPVSVVEVKSENSPKLFDNIDEEIMKARLWYPDEIEGQ